jgi:GAF domain-containing protein/HAMP domain-containing protein
MYSQERQFLWIALAILGGMLPFVVVFGWWMGEQLAAPLTALMVGVERLAGGGLQYRVNVSTRDETAILVQSFNKMVDRLNNLIATLERKVDERTHEVERRSAYLTAAAEVGRVANSILDPDQLQQQVIELIQKQFDLSYVGLFLLSEDRNWAVLHAGTGEAGQTMITRQHRIQVGEGMIGWCIANDQSRVANEINQDVIRLEIPELPGTRSEAALPLRTRGRTIGALSVQSERIKAFDDTAIVALQTMTDLVAAALDNARLFTESREAVSNDQRPNGESESDWVKVFGNRPVFGYYADKDNLTPLDERNPGLELSRLETQNVMHLPIRVRGQVLGTIHARKQDTAGIWNPEETALLETLNDQLSIALENARLLEVTQRRAARDRMVADITNKMRRAVDMDTLIQTAVREITKAVAVPEAFVQLGIPPAVQKNEEPQPAPDQRTDSPDRETIAGGGSDETLPSLTV